MIDRRIEENQALSTFVSDRTSLMALARSIVGNQAIAEELVQDSWLRWCCRQYPSQEARPILRRIVANLARDWRRRQATESHFLEMSDWTEEFEINAERIVIARQDLAIAVKALTELPQRTYTAFLLHRINGKTYAQIGEHLGISTPRAHQLVRKALVHVAMRFDEKDIL